MFFTHLLSARSTPHASPLKRASCSSNKGESGNDSPFQPVRGRPARGVACVGVLRELACVGRAKCVLMGVPRMMGCPGGC